MDFIILNFLIFFFNKKFKIWVGKSGRPTLLFADAAGENPENGKSEKTICLPESLGA